MAGSPTALIHAPAPSYMPQLAITESTWRTTSGRTAAVPVSGCTPPFASVAPTSARSRLSTRTAHCRKYRSSASSGSPITPNVRSRCAIARLRCPVTRSDSNTASSTSRARPAKLPYASSTAANDAPSATREEAVIAPAFTIAFDGTPVSGASAIELNASPLGSTPMRVATASAPCRSSARA